MPRLELDEINLDRDGYAAARADARRRMLAIRRSRRVKLGGLIALEFENEDTLHYQVQEMVYAENITTDSGAGEEIETYRRLLPTAGSVSATLFLEFTDLATVHGDLERRRRHPAPHSPAGGRCGHRRRRCAAAG